MTADLFTGHDHGPAANDEFRGSPVVLVSGRVVCSYSEAWRHECEARHVVRQAAADRAEYLNKVVAKRGEEAARRLEATMRDVRLDDEARRVAAMPSLQQRRRYLERVELSRGTFARQELEEQIRRVWRPKAA